MLFITHGIKLDHGELHQAVKAEDYELAKLFIKCGANINTLYPVNTETILMRTIRNHFKYNAHNNKDSRLEFIQFLINHGANLNLINAHGRTALNVAEYYSNHTDSFYNQNFKDLKDLLQNQKIN